MRVMKSMETFKTYLHPNRHRSCEKKAAINRHDLPSLAPLSTRSVLLAKPARSNIFQHCNSNQNIPKQSEANQIQQGKYVQESNSRKQTIYNQQKLTSNSKAKTTQSLTSAAEDGNLTTLSSIPELITARSASRHILTLRTDRPTSNINIFPSPIRATTAATKDIDINTTRNDSALHIIDGQIGDRDTRRWGSGRRAIFVILFDDDAVAGDFG